MKLTNKKILNDIHMLNNLSNLELPVKVSYKIAKNIMNIELILCLMLTNGIHNF